MATGSLDANGIWLYGEDDSEPTSSALLNKLGNSISDKFDGGLPVANGGTGATTAADAKTNLGVQQRISAGITTGNATAAGNSGGLYWSALTTVTFPVGRFSAAPIVTTTTDGAGSVTWPTLGGTPTTTNFIFFNIRVGSNPGALNVHWHAIQMTPTTGAG